MMNFKDKVVIVTGGGGTIGRAIASAFASMEARVIIADIDSKKGNSVLSDISDAGGNADFIRTDVSVRSSAEALASAVVEKYGRVDILVNCAGILKEKSLEETTEKDWDEMTSVNLTGVLYVTQAVIETMRRQKSGKVIMVTSTAAVRGRAMQIPYCTDAGTVNGFVQNTACQYGNDGICVNEVACGIIDTDFPESLNGKPEYQAFRVSHTPLNRIGKPADAVGPVLFLASEYADFITGETITADGGLSIYMNGHGL